MTLSGGFEVKRRRTTEKGAERERREREGGRDQVGGREGGLVLLRISNAGITQR